jgi:hypothetical protein
MNLLDKALTMQKMADAISSEFSFVKHSVAYNPDSKEYLVFVHCGQIKWFWYKLLGRFNKPYKVLRNGIK